ncbi:NAD(P)H-hydrate dehydratase [Aureimonas fodinaquatilis]|uniref:Bifunctional NAD(P)H-hydrate repair enzyme n=1 Tax=Aureimonas fodinaquatilis TaxID=2565783 RepID=A0A5B0DVN2_9HYPH|nr:NAD(P)H-hydrate dehydratase [Aureimonas fodinaquatilis]KAA0970536.1 NAD(P)H-hydrate dehydratase [Aureimonas fodinaquatilis]
MAFYRYPDPEVLTPEEMAQADEKAVELGVDSFQLMSSAASAIVDAIAQYFTKATHVAILAGPGNNGGDAIVAATLLKTRGSNVSLFMAREPATADARKALEQWPGGTLPLDEFSPESFDLVVDGLFGAGLRRDLAGVEKQAIERLQAGLAPVLAIDLPSGVSGLDGRVLGCAAQANLTVSFFRRKPGHLLEPGRSLCGRLLLADIGVPETVLEDIGPRIFANEPELWADALLRPQSAQHKYSKGHAAVFSGGHSRTGAARLAAMAALRAGAGLVTVLSPSSAVAVNAVHLTAIMLKRCDDANALKDILRDARLNAFVLGPGFGIGDLARDYANLVLDAKRRLVLDADGITSFASHSADLFQLAARSADNLVITPHDGEFARLFPSLAKEAALGKVERARLAAQKLAGVVVLKGADTVIAAPDGRAAINTSGTPALATAGTGDVLSGIIAAQLANGVPAFEAACAAVWLHGVAGREFGPGLIAEDMPGLLPAALRKLYSLCGFSFPDGSA